MDRTSQAFHFHVCWNTGVLDWERHETRASAEKAARQLAARDESYTIQMSFDKTCAQCNSLRYQKDAG